MALRHRQIFRHNRSPDIVHMISNQGAPVSNQDKESVEALLPNGMRPGITQQGKRA